MSGLPSLSRSPVTILRPSAYSVPRDLLSWLFMKRFTTPCAPGGKAEAPCKIELYLREGPTDSRSLLVDSPTMGPRYTGCSRLPSLFATCGFRCITTADRANCAVLAA